MSPPWTPDDRRWSWLVLGVLVALTCALVFAGSVFGQGGDPRPNAQTIPIMGIDTTGRFVLVGDLINHALRVSLVAPSALSVVVTSSALPTGASTDASVQNVEAAIREAQNFYGAAFPLAGQAVAAVDPSGFTASLAVTNSGALVTAERGAANLTTATVSVTTGATTLGSARTTRRSVSFINYGSTDVYICSPCTAATGFFLPGVRGASVELFTTAAVQGIVSTGTQTVGIIEAYH